MENKTRYLSSFSLYKNNKILFLYIFLGNLSNQFYKLVFNEFSRYSGGICVVYKFELVFNQVVNNKYLIIFVSVLHMFT